MWFSYQHWTKERLLEVLEALMTVQSSVFLYLVAACWLQRRVDLLETTPADRKCTNINDQEAAISSVTANCSLHSLRKVIPRPYLVCKCADI